MALKTFKPTTPSLRSRRVIIRSHLWHGSPYKPLTQGLTKKGGRNNQGRITIRHRGGGSKRRYRFIDFHRTSPIPLTVERIEYDPNRSAFIALMRSKETGKFSYILAPEGLIPGAIVDPLALSHGSSRTLNRIPIGSLIHNVEAYPGSGGTYIRSAGTHGVLLSLSSSLATILLPSKKKIQLSINCKATLGQLSNPDHFNTVAGKAGVSRWKGIRPTVRGEAMNPIDHPHGGKTKRGSIPRSPWGKITRNKKTT